MPELRAGDCIWIKTRDDNKPNEPEGHWFVVLFDPEHFDKTTIVVPINTYESERHDKTVLLRAGDHDCIKHDSYVNYSMAQIASQSRIDEWITKGRARIHRQNFSNELFERIKAGVKISRRTQPEIMIRYWRRIGRQD